MSTQGKAYRSQLIWTVYFISMNEIKKIYFSGTSICVDLKLKLKVAQCFRNLNFFL